MYRNLAMAKDNLDANVVHCHTWYVQFAGFLAKKLWGIPFVLTTHSL
jgi:glycogen synthase